MDLISVIVPIYNVEKYLKECVDSIINQSYKNIEIILVDDGSPDNCPSICDDYEKKDFRVKVIHQSNQGLSAARNAGIEAAKGNYIIFIDSDDYISTEMIKIMYDLISKEGSDIVISNYIRVNDSNYSFDNEVNNYNHESFDKYKSFDLLCSGKMEFVAACFKLYSSRLFENVRFPIGKINEDTFVIHWLYNDSKKITFLDMPLYAYRFREDSIMGVTERKIAYKDCLEAYNNRIKLLHKVKKQKNNIIKTIRMFWNWYFFKLPENLKMEEVIQLFNSIKMEKIIFLYYHFQDKERDFNERISLSILIICPKLYFKIFKKL